MAKIAKTSAKKITTPHAKKSPASSDACKNIYLYDFDGTIVRGDTGVKFFWWWAATRPFVFLWVPYVALCLLAHKLKLISAKKMKEEFFRFLPRDKKIADAHVQDFWNTSNAKQLNKSVVKMMKADAKDKDGIIICISGSPEFFIKPMVDKLPVDVLICTRPQKKDYRKISGENCNGHAKVRRFFAWIEKQNFICWRVVKTVSDSLKDKPIYDLANQWYAVDAHGKITRGLPKKRGTIYLR